MARPPFRFQPLAEHDLPLLFEWLNRPHVAEWWDGPISSTAVREKYSPRIGSTTVRPYLAFVNQVPVGFIQSYVAAEQPESSWPGDRDPGVIGIDQFIADADNLGKGLGTEMVRQFVRLLFQDPTISSIQTDPAPNNSRAIRCYEKAGFEKVALVETPDGPALLMVAKRGGGGK